MALLHGAVYLVMLCSENRVGLFYMSNRHNAPVDAITNDFIRDACTCGNDHLKSTAEDHGTGPIAPQRDSRTRGITSQRSQLAV